MDLRFMLMAAFFLLIGLMLVLRPAACQSFSRDFERHRSWIPMLPLVGVPLWMVRLFGFLAIGCAALFIRLGWISR
jgi:hypothetical protein